VGPGESTLTDLFGVWNDYIAEHPYRFAPIHLGAGVHVLRIWENDPMPTDFAVIGGEWLYSLRTALDWPEHRLDQTQIRG